LDTASLDKGIGIEEKLRLVAETGFDCDEPWDRELEQYEREGGDLKDSKKLVADLGLYIPSVIGLWNALDVSKEKFEARIEEHRNRLCMVSAIGSQRVQVIPNMKDKDFFDPAMASWCYRLVLDMAIEDYGMRGAGVVFLNFFSPLSTLAEATQVAFGADHEKAQVIPDTFHMFLGNSKLENFHHLQGDFITIFQFSDCPVGVKPHDRHEDKIRVFPGDGVLPLVDCLKTLKEINYRGPISLELYNTEFRVREPKAFLDEAIDKTNRVAEQGSH
jgi:sugar phosphate isomerase/epimerase